MIQSPGEIDPWLPWSWPDFSPLHCPGDAREAAILTATPPAVEPSPSGSDTCVVVPRPRTTRRVTMTQITAHHSRTTPYREKFARVVALTV